MESSLRRILKREKKIKVTANLYDGKIEAELSLVDGNLVIPEIQVSEVNLPEHSTIRSLGITTGLLNGKAKNVTITPQGKVSGEGSIYITQLAIPTDTQVIIPGLAFGVKLIAMQNGSLSAPFRFEDDKLVFPTLNFNSTWGSVRGALFLPLRRMYLSEGTSILLTLTDDGVKALGPYLMLICKADKIKVGYELHLKADKNRNGSLICNY